jgi:hypothetical protein
MSKARVPVVRIATVGHESPRKVKPRSTQWLRSGAFELAGVLTLEG